MKLASVGGVVFASRLAGAGPSKKKSALADDFFFLQLSDTHWGYAGVSNPEADVTLPKAIETVNAVAAQPDFIVFTGDLTHTTDDGAVRRKRLGEFKAMAA
ncbi:MAG TPA: metallophosphoesterase, partial [Polyangia bacterium]